VTIRGAQQEQSWQEGQAIEARHYVEICRNPG
jgi:hypothetical protein